MTTQAPRKAPGERHILALDGGGVRGVLTLRMLESFEKHFGEPVCEFFDMFAGTSTGAIIAVLLAFKRLPAAEIRRIYRDLIPELFARTPRSASPLRFLVPAMYSRDFALEELKRLFGERTLAELAGLRPGRPQAVLLTTHDLVREEEIFLSNYPFKSGSVNFGRSWRVRDAVAASALSAPWYFGPFEGRFVDGGVSIFNTPARQAALEALDYCGEPLFERGKTTVWSFGSGAFSWEFRSGDADAWLPFSWARRLFSDVQSDAEADQIYGALRMRRNGEIGFRRYQVTITPETARELGVAAEVPRLPIGLDQADALDFLDEAGERFAARIDWDDADGLVIARDRPPALEDAQLWRSESPPAAAEVAASIAAKETSPRLT